jgi:hypothetical protein
VSRSALRRTSACSSTKACEIFADLCPTLSSHARARPARNPVVARSRCGVSALVLRG